MWWMYHERGLVNLLEAPSEAVSCIGNIVVIERSTQCSNSKMKIAYLNKQ